MRISLARYARVGRRFGLGVLVSAMLAGGIAYWFCPQPDLYDGVPFSSAVFDRDGELLRLDLASDQRYRLFAPLGDIPPTVRAATLLYEDRHFLRHPGINPAALFRAAWSSYVTRTRVMGGSTVTMQLARLRFNLKTISWHGKLIQILRAVQLERHYSKDQILEAYLNLAPYGGNIEGIGTAALIYFAKPASRLNLPEAMTLAVIPQNPVGRNPAAPAGRRAMLAARDRLLAAWRERHLTPPATLAQFALPISVRTRSQLPYRAPHFSRDFLAARADTPGTWISSLDASMQSLLERQLASYLGRHRVRGIDNASAMLLNHHSMEVLALVGSGDFFDAGLSGQVNGTRAKRSPGSALKPFVYGLALDRGLIHPMSLMKDAPKRYGIYTPENFDRGFLGPVLARDALIYSRNVPAINLLARLGETSFHRFLSMAGVRDLRSAEHYGLALALGGNEVTMYELARLYALLANQGALRPIRDTPGEMSGEIEPERLLSREASYLVLDMLRHNQRPDALGLGEAIVPGAIAWKTGTSYAYRDAWSVGVIGPYILAVWVGNFDGVGNPAFVGRKAAAPLFFAVADALPLRPRAEIRADRPPVDLNLRKVDVCASTGDLPGRHCPETVKSWFIPGVSPIRVSAVHRAVQIDTRTGLRACPGIAGATREEVYEFWPSDVARIFRQAGIAVRRPPPFLPGCALEARSMHGIAPVITSPDSTITYRLRADRLSEERLSFAAVTDADAEALYWFVDERFVARVERGGEYFWRPQIGDFTVSVVDDHGRASARLLAVRAVN